MTDAERLEMLKIDLGVVASEYDARLIQYLQAAEKEIEREGVTLRDDVDHDNVIVQYAAWMWRKRDSGAGMPRMLRYALNNLIFSQHLESE